MDKSVITRVVTVAGGRFAAGHLGELTQQVPFEMVDAVLEQTCRVQRRVRDLPARVVVYLLLAGCLFAELGYSQVWHRLTAGLDGLPVAAPTASAMTQARRRLGPGPLRELFALLRGPSPAAARWRELLVCAIDGTIMPVADSAANLAVYSRQRGGRNGDSGYPMLRLLALVSCGTRSVIDAVFGPVSDGSLRPSWSPRRRGRLGPWAPAATAGKLACFAGDLLHRRSGGCPGEHAGRVLRGLAAAPLGRAAPRGVARQLPVRRCHR